VRKNLEATAAMVAAMQGTELRLRNELSMYVAEMDTQEAYQATLGKSTLVHINTSSTATHSSNVRSPEAVWVSPQKYCAVKLLLKAKSAEADQLRLQLKLLSQTRQGSNSLLLQDQLSFDAAAILPNRALQKQQKADKLDQQLRLLQETHKAAFRAQVDAAHASKAVAEVLLRLSAERAPDTAEANVAAVTNMEAAQAHALKAAFDLCNQVQKIGGERE